MVALVLQVGGFAELPPRLRALLESEHPLKVSFS